MDTQSDAAPILNVEDNLNTVLRELKDDDIRKFYFLCLDKLTISYCPKTAEEILSSYSSFNLTEFDKCKLLQELLFLIKKHKLLKILKTCRHEMEVQIKDNGPYYVDQGRLLLFKLCEDLKESDIDSLKRLLKIQNISHNQDLNNVAAEKFFSTWIRVITKDKIKSLQNALSVMKYNKIIQFENEFRSYFDRPFYVITPSPGRPCGLAIIFIFENFNFKTKINDGRKSLRIKDLEKRDGAKEDEKTLINLWHNHGFDVLVFNDLCSTDMIQIIEELKKFHFIDYCIFTLCISTHGHRNMIFTSDNIPLDIDNDIVHKFCIGPLKEKPKLFFIQACQNQVYPPGTSCTEPSIANMKDSLPYYNLLIATSTIPLYSSYRTKEGSIFINILANTINESDTNKTNIEQLLNIVSRQVSKQRLECDDTDVAQMPERRITIMDSLLYFKKFQGSSFQKLGEINSINCPILFELIESFLIKPDVYLV